MMKPTVILVTISYPFTNNELTFIDPEINYLLGSCSELYIISLKGAGEILSSNKELIKSKIIFPDLVRGRIFRRILRLINIPLSLLKNRDILTDTICMGDRLNIKRLIYLLYMISYSDQLFRDVKQKIMKLDIKSDNVIIYSYWLSETSTIAIKISKLLKQQNKKVKIVSRAHGYDVFKDRSRLKWIPLQSYNIKYIDEIYSCSENGKDYLKGIYPDYKDKMFCSYLGVKDFGFSLPINRNSIFKVVSCSNVNEVKRVNRIVIALSLITNLNIEWTHFGDGPLFNELLLQCKKMLKPNITYHLLGNVENSQIIDFYIKEKPNLFINVSTSEGLPVSIMEATSFGTPIIATRVGGNPEICINNRNGILINKDFDDKELVDAINKINYCDDNYYQNLCRNSRRIFESKFNSDINFTNFDKKITNV